LGKLDFMRVPLPAAKTATASFDAMALSPVLCPLQVLSRLGVYRTSHSTRQPSWGRALVWRQAIDLCYLGCG
jgi:hypothetical protein